VERTLRPAQDEPKPPLRLAQRPRDEADADRLPFGRIELLLEPGRVTVAPAAQAKTAGAGDCRG
jgi:hypothetical protein